MARKLITVLKLNTPVDQMSEQELDQLAETVFAQTEVPCHRRTVGTVGTVRDRARKGAD
jgi:hypothetical protein